MNVNDLYQSTSENLKAEDLKQQEHELVIEQVTQETIPDDSGPKDMLKLHFKGQEKGLLLNKTNAMSIADHMGGNTDNWVNRPIILFPTTTPFGDKIVPCIRIRHVLERAAQGAPLGQASAQQYADASGARTDGGPPVDTYNDGML